VTEDPEYPADERPSFRRRVDVLRLAGVLLAPWVLGGVAYLFPLTGGMLFGGSDWPGWGEGLVHVGFYSLGISSILAPVIGFFFGVWRLIRRRGYRRSWYGWLWLVFMYLNACAVGSAMH
jgi:hypothetical protein